MKIKLTFYIFIFSVIQNYKAQETILYGLANTYPDNSIVSFDYMSQTYDTLFQLPFLASTSTCLTLNPFKKIIYFYSYPGTITAIDIDSATYYNVANLTGQINGSIIELQYDYFSNSLVFEDNSSVRRYNLNNNTLELITNVYKIGATNNSTPSSAYNQIDQKFYAINTIDTGYFDFVDYSILVDCHKNLIIDTMNFTTNNSFGMLTYNHTDNQYYAYDYHQNEVIRISSLTETQTTICNFNYQSLLNFQSAAFDYNNGLYLFPFYPGIPKLAIINVNTGHIDTINFHPFNYQLFFGGRNPLLKRDGNFLLGSYCGNYTWYLNDSLIQDSISQTLHPAIAGFYKFSTNIGTKKYFSNEINFDINSINEKNNTEINIVIFPNPATNNISIDVPKKTTIEILNIEGQLIKTIECDGKTTIINLLNLSSGVYIVKAKTEQGIAVRKFIKQ